jgi:ADP-ribose pyrophosphatase YjhB (NUDIX family)
MRWIPDDKYRQVLELVPMPTVDVLPCLADERGGSIGLILRDDAEGGKGWNLVGGGVRRGESIAEAAARHVAETLGEGFTWRRDDFSAPDTLGEYFPERRDGHPYDPRKHAIAATYVILPEGTEAEVGGEALEFGWFPLAGDLPSPIGFGQEAVIRRLVPAARRLLET